MCGILGIVQKGDDRRWDPCDFKSALRGMIKRGPDRQKIWRSSDGSIALGHTRLAIQDLSDRGDQPIFIDSENYCMIFNGEIYNFKSLRDELTNRGYFFSSGSDTEVLLVAYACFGAEVLSRLNGMFAFAIYDKLKSCLFLARDPSGQKPLFYRYEHNYFEFASTLECLLTNPKAERRLDINSMDEYFAYGYVSADETLITGIKKLMPGVSITVDIETMNIEFDQYWKLPSYIPNTLSEDDLVSELECILTSAISDQLIADVNVGVLLSGGLDSSIITALASRSGQLVNTYTVGFKDAGKLDERDYAAQIASYFGTRHHVLELNPASVTPELLMNVTSAFDEPLFDSSAIPTYLVSQLVATECKVALGGDGGDELFAGYRHYQSHYFTRYPKYARKLFYKLIDQNIPLGLKGRDFLLRKLSDTRLLHHAYLFSPASRNKLIPQLQKNVAEKKQIEFLNEDVSSLTRAQIYDFNNYLPNDILVKVDRASMAHSLEMRSPMLDVRLIEFAFAKVPESLKLQNKNRKILLKKLAEKILPESYELNRKQGFSIPLNQWMTGPTLDLMYDTINSKSAIFDQDVIKTIFQNFEKGFTNADRIYALFMFESWRRRLNVTF